MLLSGEISYADKNSNDIARPGMRLEMCKRRARDIGTKKLIHLQRFYHYIEMPRFTEVLAHTHCETRRREGKVRRDDEASFYGVSLFYPPFVRVARE